MEGEERRLSLSSATRLNGCTKQLAGSPCSLLSPCQESSSYLANPEKKVPPVLSVVNKCGLAQEQQVRGAEVSALQPAEKGLQVSRGCMPGTKRYRVPN